MTKNINEAQLQEIISQKIDEYYKNNPINEELEENDMEEGALGKFFGGAIGLTLGHWAMVAACKALKIDETGPIGQILTSKAAAWAICRAIGGALLEEGKDNLPLNEVNWGAIGGIIGFTVVNKAMKALCKQFGVDPNGVIGQLLCSKMVCMTVSAAIARGIANKFGGKSQKADVEEPAAEEPSTAEPTEEEVCLVNEIAQRYVKSHNLKTLNEGADVAAIKAIISLCAKIGISADKALKALKLAKAGAVIGSTAYDAYKAGKKAADKAKANKKDGEDLSFGDKVDIAKDTLMGAGKSAAKNKLGKNVGRAMGTAMA